MKNILRVEKIEKYYGNKDNVVKAIDHISFRVDEIEVKEAGQEIWTKHRYWFIFM